MDVDAQHKLSSSFARCSPPAWVASKQLSKERSPKTVEDFERGPLLPANNELRHSMQSMKARPTC